jgi:recF protein
MKCTTVTTENFRNLTRADIEFADGVTVLCGQNAQGKTNILEAVYLFARGRSFRTHRDGEMIRFGEKSASVSLKYEHINGYKTEVKNLRADIFSSPMNGKSSGKQFYRNGIKLDSASEIIGDFRAVLFAPEHLSLVCEGPSFRRSFADIAISQLKPVYITLLSRHNAIVNQRNALLKSAAQNGYFTSKTEQTNFAALLEPWSEQLAAVDAEITVRRCEYVNRLNEHVRTLFANMTNEAEYPTLKYSSTAVNRPEEVTAAEICAKYIAALSGNIEKEVKYASTAYGIHKDDIAISINEKEARLFASQGQQRSLALMMKLAEGEISREETGEYPVFLLDDVMGELDSVRRQFVLSELKNRQVIVTSCEPSLFENTATTDAKFIKISNGTPS